MNMRTPEGRAKVLKARKDAEVHLRFCAAMYRFQMEGGRYFLHEHPRSAVSWEVPCMKSLIEDPRVCKVKADMCQFGMKSTDQLGEAYVKKPTTFLTNSLEMSKSLSRRCTPGEHRHVHLMEGRAAAAAIYPPGLCRAVLKGITKQARVDRGNLMSFKCVDDVNEVCQVEFEPESWMQYWDDVSGKVLKKELVEAARAEELATVKRMKV